MYEMHGKYAMGWTHLWDGAGQQVAITDDQAAFLVVVGLARFSGDYKVYRPLVPMETIRKVLVLP